MGIYLDNACTSSPKSPCVAQAVAAYLSGGAFNVNRGGYEGALDAEGAVLGCRELLAGLLGAPDPRNVVFTSGDTEAINLVLRGLLNPGDHVVVSSMEHNAVMRPLTSLARAGVTFTRVACAPDGTLDPADVAAAMEPKTRLVIMTRASNVCGTILPLAEVGAIAQRTHLCMVGGIRDMILFRESKLLLGFVAILVAALVTNLVLASTTGGAYFNLGFEGQPIAHTDGVWNFLGMALAGLACFLLGGCPLRQLVLSGEGNADSAVAILGLAMGAAFCHNFGLVSSADGTTPAGRVAVVTCLVVVVAIAVANTFGRKR